MVLLGFWEATLLKNLLTEFTQLKRNLTCQPEIESGSEICRFWSGARQNQSVLR